MPAELKSDLGPFYGPAAERAGFTRATFGDIKTFYTQRAAAMQRAPQNCTDCKFFRGVTCTNVDDTVPEDFRKTGCEEWQWDEIPF